MAAYLESAEDIARKKLTMYSELLQNISAFKQNFMQPNNTSGAAADVNVPKEFIRLPGNKQN